MRRLSKGDDTMVDVGVALMWIAISSASVKGLSVLARAAATTDREAERAASSVEVTWARDGVPTLDYSHAYRLRNRP
jgi:hypothetical protein